jgi:hypothetical protein
MSNKFQISIWVGEGLLAVVATGLSLIVLQFTMVA